MNILDMIILAIIAISVIFGIYRGFIRSVLSVVCFFISLVLAFQFSPVITGYLYTNTGLATTLATYTDAVVRVGDYETASKSVSETSPSFIDSLMKDLALPPMIEDVLHQAFQQRSYDSLGLTTVNDYVQNTLVGVVVNILSFCICFFLAFFLLSLLSGLVHYVFKLPVLKQLDWLAGALLGFVRGGLIIYIVFLLIPLLETVGLSTTFSKIFNESQLLPIFSSEGLFMKVISGRML